jgi:hypothetical protein
VDGNEVWPKLPAYLRLYLAKWQRGQAAKRTAKEAAAGAKVLLNTNTLYNEASTINYKPQNIKLKP